MRSLQFFHQESSCLRKLIAQRGILLLAIMLPTLAFASGSSRQAAEAVNALGIDLLSRVAGPGDNPALSPYSIQLALAMTWAGAAGSTREQMSRVLHLPDSDVLQSFAALQEELDGMITRSRQTRERFQQRGEPSEPMVLDVANRLFGQAGYEFRPAYLALVKGRFAAALEPLDFDKNPSAVRKQINGWVAKKTRDRIRDLIPDGAITSETRLVLANAVYFKAPWSEPFKENLTEQADFHLPGGQAVKVPTMRRQDSLGYRQHKGFRAVALPYAEGDLQFLVLLPDTPNGLPVLEKQLTPSLLAQCAKLPLQDVLLYLPKFKLQPAVFSLSDVLQKLGMRSAFNIPAGSADFDGIAPRRSDDYLYISDVFHKTFVSVDEQGTEAAAATAVVMLRATGRPGPQAQPIEVRVDRPFLFAIQHRPSGACLFLGSVSDPR